MKWFALDANFLKHPKTLALSRIMSDKNAVIWILEFWSWLAQQDHDGVFFWPNSVTRNVTPGPNSVTRNVRNSELLDAIISSTSVLTGQHNSLYDAMLEAGFLDLTDDAIVVHGWLQRHEKHKEINKKAAMRMKKWREKNKPEVTAKVTAKVTRNVTAKLRRDIDIDIDSTTKNPVVPFSGNGELQLGDERKEKSGGSFVANLTRQRMDLLWERWFKKMNSHLTGNGRPSTDEKFTKRKQGYARAALADNSFEKLCKSIDGLFLSPHHLGKTKGNNIEFLDFKFSMKADNVENFARLADSPPSPQRANQTYDQKNGTDWDGLYARADALRVTGWTKPLPPECYEEDGTLKL